MVLIMLLVCHPLGGSVASPLAGRQSPAPDMRVVSDWPPGPSAVVVCPVSAPRDLVLRAGPNDSAISGRCSWVERSVSSPPRPEHQPSMTGANAPHPEPSRNQRHHPRKAMAGASEYWACPDCLPPGHTWACPDCLLPGHTWAGRAHPVF